MTKASDSSVLDQIPPPEVIIRRLGETLAERRVLIALLKTSRRKQATVSTQDTPMQEGVRCAD